MNKYPKLVTITLNTFYQFLARLVTGVAGLLITRVLALKIGLAGYGQYQMVIAYASLFWVFTDFGLSALMVREASSKIFKFNQLLGSVLTIKTIFSLILIILGLFGLFIFPFTSEVKVAIALGLLTILVQAHISVLTSLFQIYFAYGYQLVTVFLGSSVWLFGILALIAVNQTSLLNLSSLFVLNYVIILGVGLILLRKKVKFSFVFDKRLIKQVFSLALPLGLAQLLNLLAYKQDSFLLSVLPLSGFSNAQAVGIYALAYKFFEIGIVLPMFFMNVLYPMLSMSFAQKKFSSFKQHCISSSLFLALAGILGLFFYQTFSPFLISLLSKSAEFTASIPVLRILGWSLPASYLLPLCMYLLIIFRRQKWLFVIYLYGFLVNLLINLALIPKLTYYAAAWATVATEWSMLILFIVAIIVSWKRIRAKN